MPAPRTTRRLAALLLVPPLLLGACGGDDEPAAEGTGAEADFTDHTGEAEVTIAARDNSFVPQYVEISAGTEVTFDNRGRNAHNAVPVEDGAFDEVPTDELQPGDSATVTFDEAGTYPYYCTLHGTETAGMVGTIRVVD